ncbi:MAG: hypothetical protein ABFS56_31865 [Pseudomonadota bacterium]
MSRVKRFNEPYSNLVQQQWYKAAGLYAHGCCYSIVIDDVRKMPLKVSDIDWTGDGLNLFSG